jgi:hypothetical protein
MATISIRIDVAGSRICRVVVRAARPPLPSAASSSYRGGQVVVLVVVARRWQWAVVAVGPTCVFFRFLILFKNTIARA